MIDDWKEDVLPRLEKSLLYLTLKERCQEKDSEVIALVDTAVSYALQRTKTILRHMGEYTLHDGDHLFRVLFLMEKLIGQENVRAFSTPELMLLVLSAFFHDIGMAPDEIDVIAWKKVWDSSPIFTEPIEEGLYNKFRRYYSARPEQQEAIDRLLEKGDISRADTLKGYLISDYIRQTHAERAREIVEKDWKDKILYRDANLTVEFAQICYSHNEDALSVLELDQNYLCGPNTVACLPLVAIILRLADILDFDGKRTPSILFSHLNVRHPISLKEWNKHRAIEAWEISPDLIQYSAKCNHPAIEASIHDFCDLIDRELSICNNIVSTLNDFNKGKGRGTLIKFPFKVDREKIRTQKSIKNEPLYIYRETQFNLSKRQVIDLLMGTKLYGNPEVALRELLQNSIDACLLREAQEKKWSNLYEPEITVKYYSEGEDEILEVMDNGTGMDLDIIDNYYSKIGSSFYKSTDFYNLKAETNANFSPTSRFGIGILSSFMVADTLIVDTKRVYAHHKSSDPLNITVEGQESIFWIRPGQREAPGTTTKLMLRKSKNPWDKMTEEEFIKSVETVLPNPPFKINILTSMHQKVRDQNSFREIKASSMKDYSWEGKDNIRLFEFELDKKETGIVGSAIVGVLEKAGKPVKEMEVFAKDIEIDGETYSLERKLWVAENAIRESSRTISIDDEGEIKIDSSSREYAQSKSRISLHGIEVPASLFPPSWSRKNNQVKISWPFPFIIVADICGNRDIDLNSARTEIILSDKWIDFEEELASQICAKIQSEVPTEYWSLLKEILLSINKSEEFKRGLSRVS